MIKAIDCFDRFWLFAGSYQNWSKLCVCVCVCVCVYIQGVRGGKVSILRGHSTGHSKQKSAYVHEQHAMSSHELQSALILTAEFLKMYYTR
jgi:hypothetical protein